MNNLKRLSPLKALHDVQTGAASEALVKAFDELWRQRGLAKAGNADIELWTLEMPDGFIKYVVGSETNETLLPGHGEFSYSNLPEKKEIKKFKFPVDVEKKA